MAINKRKILQSAQKHVQKGNLEKAAEDYQKVCKADPKDTSVRLKLGDLFLKLSRNDDAVATYLKVAEQFMKEGFDAKAVALYKQITKLDPKRRDVSVPLAELYQRMGLIPDAMAALQAAADAAYQDGEKDEALSLLRKMAALDPANTKNRVKVAELLHQEGYVEEAVAEYNEVLEELERQGDEEEHVRVLARLVEVDPSRTASAVELARTQLSSGNAADARDVAQSILDRTPDDIDAREVLGLSLEKLGDAEACGEVMRSLAELCRERGDEDRARELMQRYGATTEFSADGTDEPALETDRLDDGSNLEIDQGISTEGMGGGGPEFSDPGFQADGMHIGEAIDGIARTPDAEPEAADDDLADELDIDLDGVDESIEGASSPAVDLSLEELDEPDADLEPGPAADDTPPVEEASAPKSADQVEVADQVGVVDEVGVTDEIEDADQAFAEASVYLRYGKQDRAIDMLRGILAIEPEHVGALVKLGEVLVLTEDKANAATAFERAIVAADSQGSDALLESARTQLAAIDPSAAQALLDESAPDPAGDDDPVDDDEIVIDDDIDLDIGDELDEDDSIDASDADEPDLVDQVEVVDEVETADEVEIADQADVSDDVAEQVLSDDDGTDELDFDLDIDADDEANLDAASSDPGEDLDLSGIDDEPALNGDVDDTTSGKGGSTTSVRVQEDLEEAAFYMEQGLLAEAREVYERILTIASNHPQAMLRIGEIDATIGDPVEGENDAPESDEGTTDEFEAPLEFVTDEPASEPDPSVAGELTFVTDDDSGDSEEEPPQPETFADAEATRPEADAEITAREAPAPEVAAEATDLEPSADPEPDVSAEPETDPNESSGDGGEFDLAAQLSDVFGEEQDAVPGGIGGSTEEEGFEQVFAAFKQGVQSELGEGDHEAHYDLGIAYKEMGLLDDAIGEFQQAMAAPDRALPCLHMMGLCALDLGRTADACSHLEQALSLPNVPDEKRIGIQFDLGRSLAKSGDVERARACFEAVQAIDANFCEVGTLIAELESAPSEPDEAESEEAFESFDDLIGNDDDEDSEPPLAAEPEYESFDEFMDEEDEEEHDAPVEDTPEPATPEPVVAEATEPIGEPDALDADEPLEELEPMADEAEPEPEPEAKPPKRRKRKKKISFV